MQKMTSILILKFESNKSESGDVLKQ